MKRLVILFILLPLTVGIISGIYSHKNTKLPEVPIDVLEIKGTELLEKAPAEIEVTIRPPRKKLNFTDSRKPKIPYYDIPLSKELQEYTYKKCQKSGVPYELVLAIMKVESNYKSDLISRTNDYGLMQINKVNHGWLKKKLGVTDFLDPKQNIDCGIYMLKELFDKYSDEHKVLMAYNFGEGGMKRNWKKGVRSSKYSRKVLQTREELVGGTSE